MISNFSYASLLLGRLSLTFLCVTGILAACGKEDSTRHEIEPPQTLERPSQSPDMITQDPSEKVISKENGKELNDNGNGEEHPRKKELEKPSMASLTADELVVIAGIENSSAEQAFQVCNGILTQGVHNQFTQMSSLQKNDEAIHFLCSTDSGIIVEKYFNKSANQSQRGSASVEDYALSSSFPKFPFSASVSRQNSANQSAGQAKEFATEEMNQWKKQHCSTSAATSGSAYAHHVLSQTVSDVVVDAWKSCMTQKNHGFFCSSQNIGNETVVHLKWSPNPLAARVIPKIKLDLQTQSNVKVVSKHIPSLLGVGSGASLTFTSQDPHVPIIISFSAQDEGLRINMTCDLLVPARPKYVTMAHPSCGIKSYRSGTSAVCGIESYHTGSSAVCGVKTRASYPSPACGIKRYRSLKSAICGVSGYSKITGVRLEKEDSADVRACRKQAQSIHGAGADLFYPFIKIENRRAQVVGHTPVVCQGGCGREGCDVLTEENSVQRICRGGEPIFADFVDCMIPADFNTCEHSSFGVAEYHSCAHESHPAVEFHSCVHESFGIKSYKTCEHANFGIQEYHACLIRVDSFRSY